MVAIPAGILAAVGAASAVASTGLAAASLLKKPKVPALVPTATRDDAGAQDEAVQRLRKRRGAAANELLGPAGAEAGTTQTTGA